MPEVVKLGMSLGSSGLRSWMPPFLQTFLMMRGPVVSVEDNEAPEEVSVAEPVAELDTVLLGLQGPAMARSRLPEKARAAKATKERMMEEGGGGGER